MKLQNLGSPKFLPKTFFMQAYKHAYNFRFPLSSPHGIGVTSYASYDRYHPSLKIHRPHYGIDLAPYKSSRSASVIAADDGILTLGAFDNDLKGYQTVYLRSKSNPEIIFQYVHIELNKQILDILKKKGSYNVVKGEPFAKLITDKQKLAAIKSTGAHLHFSIMIDKNHKINNNYIWKDQYGRIFLKPEYINEAVAGILTAPKPVAKGDLLSYRELRLNPDNKYVATEINEINYKPVTFLKPTITQDYSDVEELMALPSAVDNDSVMIIGDTDIVIDPNLIHVMFRDFNYEYPTVNTCGNPVMKTGNGEIEISVTAIFSDLDEANNKLRRIIAQFMKTPFTLVENRALNRLILVEVLPAVAMPERISFSGEAKIVELETSIVKQVTENVINGVYDANKGKSIFSKMKSSEIKTFIKDRVEQVIEKSEEKLNKEEKELIYRETEEKLLPLLEWIKTYKEIEYRAGISFEDQPLSVALNGITLSNVEGNPGAIKAEINMKLFNYFPFTDVFAFCRTERDAAAQILNMHRFRIGKTYNPLPVNYTLSPGLSEPYKDFYMSIIDGTSDRAERWYDPSENKLKALTESNYDDFSFFYFYTTNPDIRSFLDSSIKHLEILDDVIDFIRDAKDADGKPIFSSISYGDFDKLNIRKSLRDVWRYFIRMIKLYFMETENYAKQILFQLQELPPDIARELDVSERSEIEKKWKNFANEVLVRNIVDLITNSGSFAEMADATLNEVLDRLVTQFNDPTRYPNANHKRFLLFQIIRKSVTQMIQNDNAALYLYSKSHKFNLKSNDRVVITNWSATFSNKLKPMKILNYNIVTYQYLGRNNWEVTLNLRTNDEKVIKEIRHMHQRIQYSAVIRTKFLKKLKGEILPMLIDTTGSGLFGFLGIKNVVINYIDVQSVPQNPGWFNIVISFTQADLFMSRFEKLWDIRLTTPRYITKMYNAINQYVDEASDNTKYIGPPYIMTGAMFFDRILEKFVTLKSIVDKRLPPADKLVEGLTHTSKGYFDLTRETLKDILSEENYNRLTNEMRKTKDIVGKTKTQIEKFMRSKISSLTQEEMEKIEEMILYNKGYADSTVPYPGIKH